METTTVLEVPTRWMAVQVTLTKAILHLTVMPEVLALGAVVQLLMERRHMATLVRVDGVEQRLIVGQIRRVWKQ